MPPDREAFAEGRERTLREALALSPAERVALAESLWQELARGRDRSDGFALAG
jgi:hypothetical protein